MTNAPTAGPLGQTCLIYGSHPRPGTNSGPASLAICRRDTTLGDDSSLKKMLKKKIFTGLLWRNAIQYLQACTCVSRFGRRLPTPWCRQPSLGRGLAIPGLAGPPPSTSSSHDLFLPSSRAFLCLLFVLPRCGHGWLSCRYLEYLSLGSRARTMWTDRRFLAAGAWIRDWIPSRYWEAGYNLLPSDEDLEKIGIKSSVDSLKDLRDRFGLESLAPLLTLCATYAVHLKRLHFLVPSFLQAQRGPVKRPHPSAWLGTCICFASSPT